MSAISSANRNAGNFRVTSASASERDGYEAGKGLGTEHKSRDICERSLQTLLLVTALLQNVDDPLPNSACLLINQAVTESKKTVKNSAFEKRDLCQDAFWDTVRHHSSVTGHSSVCWLPCRLCTPRPRGAVRHS